MSAQIIDGSAIAEQLQQTVSQEVARLQQETGRVPGLATMLVGDNPASQTYVRMKQRRCNAVGIHSIGVELPNDVPQEEVIAKIQEFNLDPSIHGILVQLPLPEHLDEEAVLSTVALEKDVDGFHPVNIGRLAMKGRTPLFEPCTPAGVIRLIDSTGIRIEGSQAVVLGRSNIVGLPVAMLLLKRNATVTICHSRSHDLPAITRQADILVAAVGRTEMVKSDWIKPGAVVIDVGINQVADPTAKRGYRLVGDVDFEQAREVAGWLTPVPGGVGPMTIAMLLQNTLTSAKRAFGLL